MYDSKTLKLKTFFGFLTLPVFREQRDSLLVFIGRRKDFKSSTSMSYAYRFKYILIGDTGTAFFFTFNPYHMYLFHIKPFLVDKKHSGLRDFVMLIEF